MKLKQIFITSTFIVISCVAFTSNSFATPTPFDYFTAGHISRPTTDNLNDPGVTEVVNIDGSKTLSLDSSGTGNLNSEPQSGTGKLAVDVESGILKNYVQAEKNNGFASALSILGDTITVVGPGITAVQFGFAIDGVISSTGSLPIGGQVVQTFARLATPGTLLPPEVTGNFSDFVRPFNGDTVSLPGLLIDDKRTPLSLVNSFSADGPFLQDLTSETFLSAGTYQVIYAVNILGITQDNSSTWTADFFNTAHPVFNVTDGFAVSSLGGGTYFGTFAPGATTVSEPSAMLLFGLGLAGLVVRKRLIAD